MINILSILSIVALIPLVLEYGFVAGLSLKRRRRGANGYTIAIMWWALASVLYMGNDVLKASLMSMDYLANRGLILAVGSLFVRVCLLASVSYMLWVMKVRSKKNEEL